MYQNISEARDALCHAGKMLAARHWTPATSGNFSLRFGDEFLITRSGADKGQLSATDILRLDHSGKALDAPKSSAETDLHLHLYRLFENANCVLHVHSLYATAISMLHDQVHLSGYELLKALPGIETHQVAIRIPVLPNSQDMQDIMRSFNEVAGHETLCAYLIRGHGMYCWGNSIHETIRIIEALDFIFQCQLLVQPR